MSKRYIDGLIDALIIVQNYANNPDWDHDACYAIYMDIEAEIAARQPNTRSKKAHVPLKTPSAGMTSDA